ncbi:MAG: ParB N-terminal domain-containing protein [Clostridia bacterium]|nr:ParB N-terminal domain-containing protein [Clostridia bacterium]
MAKKTFSAGTTKSGVLNNDGGEKLREMQAKAQYNFKYIPKEKIIPNPKNEQYTQDGIEALKESILVNGLRHNLSVLYDAETDLYRLISGERRYHAICQMTDKEYRDNFPAGIPCKIEKSDVTAIDEEIMLISANHDVRESSMEVKRWEVSRLLELYEAKKLKGEIKNIHAEIANQLNISERQARKYTTAEKLIPELSELLNSNGIDLNQADKFGKLDEDAQKTILSIIRKNGTIENAEFQSIKKLSEERANEAKQYKEKLDSANKEIEDKEETIRLLEQKINNIQKNNSLQSEQNKEDLVKYAMQAKEKAEREKAKMEAQVEKLKQQQKEKEQRQTSISDSELKRINSIAKLEQSLNLLETNFDVLKNNKSIIKNDTELKIRVEILKDRLVDLIDSL